jgi:hypothetical protein
VAGEAHMPGDPKECREQAAKCKLLAEAATLPEMKDHFITLAAQWERLAAEHESAEAFLRTVIEIEFPAHPPMRSH